MRVSLFVTCLVDQLYPQVGLKTVEVLDRLGVEVEFDSRQTCCGQPAFNTGYQSQARRVGFHFLEAFADKEVIVSPSGSCVSMIRVFLPGLFPAESPERKLAEEVAGRTYEFSEFLVDVLGVQSLGARFNHVVTYHDSCHLLRELRIANQPRQLIRAVEGIDFREMRNSDRCCGFGGTFSVKLPELSVSMCEDKIDYILETGAEFVVGNDISCLMNIGGRLQRKGLPIQTLHLVELLAATGTKPSSLRGSLRT